MYCTQEPQFIFVQCSGLNMLSNVNVVHNSSSPPSSPSSSLSSSSSPSSSSTSNTPSPSSSSSSSSGIPSLSSSSSSSSWTLVSNRDRERKSRPRSSVRFFIPDMRTEC